MKTLSNPPQSKWKQLTGRPVVEQRQLTDTVEKMFAEIRLNGNEAVLAYSRQFDYASQQTLSVSQETIDRATQRVSETLKQAMALAAKNIESFHRAQQEEIRKVETSPGVVCWRESRPIEQIGIYIPGGSAPLFSTVLMLSIPAKIAGCRKVVLCTPPNRNGEIHPAILYAARLTGITDVFAVGGIQAIGAMTFGTEAIPKVDKIFGPGNQYVTAAKQVAQYYGTAIDMPAGPSELLVIADHSCNPTFVAADLLSQAEHGPDSQVILLSDSGQVIKQIQQEIELLLPSLPRQEVAAQALKNSRSILFKDVDTCIAFSNCYAPEHLILATADPLRTARLVTNAGSVFLGNWSCESAGDYASGTNHTLPTNGHAKAYSGISLDSFVKKITFQQLTGEGMTGIGRAIETMAEAEQLHGHKNAVTLRLEAIQKALIHEKV